MRHFIKQKFKNLFENKYIQKVIAWILHLTVWFIYKTSKITIKGNYKELAKYTKDGNSVFIFTWHGRIMISPMELKRFFADEIKKGKKLSVLASGHRDGKIASAIASTFDIESVEGSTIDPKKTYKNKRSFSSIREIMNIIPQNRAFVFAADGPRGPAFKINTKITNIAQKTGVPITCIGVSYTKKIQLHTWDKFQIPLPFGEITFNYGKLHFINKDEDIEKINQVLQKELNKISGII